MALYTAKAIGDRTPVAPDLSVMQSFDTKRRLGLRSVNKLAEGFDKQQKAIDIEADKQQKKAEANLAKQRKIYAQSQVNLGNSAIREASITYKDDIVKFDEAVNKAVETISNGLQSDEEIIEFRSKISLQLNPTRAQIQKNYDNKVNEKYNESIQEEAQLILDNSVENIGLITGNQGGDILANLGQLSELAKEKDQYDNYILTDKQRAKIADYHDNQEFYTALAVAKEAKAAGNTKKLEREYNYLIDNKESVIKERGLSQDQYTDLLEATKPSKESLKQDPIVMAQTKAGIGANIKVLDLGDDLTGQFVSKKKGVELMDIYSAIKEVDDAHQNKLITDAYYSKNITDLKAAYYNMEVDKKLFKKQGGWFGKDDTIGTNIMTRVEKMTKGYKGYGTSKQALKFDLSKMYIEKLTSLGYKLDKVSVDEEVKANKIMNEIDKDIMTYINPNVDPKRLETQQGRDLVTKEQAVKLNREKAQAILNINNKNYERFIRGNITIK